MKKILLLLIISLLNFNCYLSDLEGYKHLENHDYDYMYINSLSQSLPSVFTDSSFDYRFSIQTDFSINRTLYVRFFNSNDTATATNLIYITGDNNSVRTNGIGNFTYNFSWTPSLCSQYFKIKAYAVSDVDTVVSSFDFYNPLHFYCQKGEVDSFTINIPFGNDSNLVSFIAPLQYVSGREIDHSRNPIIITQFSKIYNKTFIMIFTEGSYIDSKYNFITPADIDTLEKLNPLQHCYFFECDNSRTVDREVLCNIWMKNGHSRYTRSVQELANGKQYLLVHPIEFYNNYLLFLLRINNIIYSNEFSGIAECTLFVLN